MRENPPNKQQYFTLVWDIVRQVPTGIVTTYGQIASMIPAPPGAEDEDYPSIAPRWVGNAMNAVSRPDIAGEWDSEGVPWQRVINSKGKISMAPESRGAVEQRKRLLDEGVVFDEKDRVDFNKYGWDGPDESWLDERGLHAPVSLKSQSSDDDDQPQQLSLF